MKREFTGVFIPAHIWTSKEITAIGKMLLAEIDALSQSTGWCYASRAHFAEWLGTTEANLSLHFKKLSDAGFLEIERVPGETNKMRVVADRFYLKEGVRKTYGGGKENLPVNTIERKIEKEDESASPSQAAETLGLKAEVLKKDDVPPAAPAPAAPAWQPFTPSGELQKMRTDFRCMERFQKETGLPESQYETAIAAFALVAETIQHSGPNDLRQHFFNWSRKPEVVERLRPKPQQHINRSPYAAPAGPVKFG